MANPLTFRLLTPTEARAERSRLCEGLEALDPSLTRAAEDLYERATLRRAMFGTLRGLEDQSPRRCACSPSPSGIDASGQPVYALCAFCREATAPLEDRRVLGALSIDEGERAVVACEQESTR